MLPYLQIFHEKVSENTIFNCFNHFLICEKNILPIGSEICNDFFAKTSIFDPINHHNFLNISYIENDEIISINLKMK